jgi:hypothetical protein
MHVYGEWNAGEGGLKAGDVVSWRINGAEATQDAPLQWQDDRTPHSIALEGTIAPLYLPLIGGASAPIEDEVQTDPSQFLFLPLIGGDPAPATDGEQGEFDLSVPDTTE